LRPAVGDRGLDQNIFRVGLGVLDEHVKVTVVVEYTGVEQFKLGLVPARRRFSSTNCV